MGHSCRALLWDTLVGHSYRTLLWDTLNSCGTHLWDALVGHSCGTLIRDTLAGHACRTLLWDMRDTLVGHSCGTLLRDTLVGHSYGTLLWGTLLGHCCGTLLWDTLVGHSCGKLLWDQKSRCEAARRAFRTRLSPKVTRQVSKTSVSYETSSKSHASSLQNARFVRDFLQKSRVKSPKRAFRARLPPKLTCQSLQNEDFVRDFLQKSSGNTHRSTHITQPCQAVSRVQPLETTPVNPNVTATFTSTTTHDLTIPCACHESFRIHTSNAHKVLRLPRQVTSVTPRNLTISCAYHKNCTSTHQKPHKVLRLPRKVTISSHVSFNKICTTPHVWNDFDPF